MASLKKTWAYRQSKYTERKRFLRLRTRFERRGFTPVYLDESGFEEELQRQNAYALRGQKVYDTRSGGRVKRTNLLLAQVGKTSEKLLAPMLFDTSCNTNVFNDWLEKMLVPELPPKSLVILDNAAFHKSQTTKEIIENAGHELLFLPPYSPQLNPIEQTFANLKAKLKKHHLTTDQICISV